MIPALALVGCIASSCTLLRMGERAVMGRPELPLSFTQARVWVSYSQRHGTFKVSRLFNSISLSKMATVLTLGDRTYSSSDTKCVNVKIRRDPLRMIIRSSFPGGPTWDTQFEIRIHANEGKPALDQMLREAYGLSVTCRLTTATQTAEKPAFALAGLVLTEKEASACRLDSLESAPHTDFHDPKRRCALHLTAQRVTIGPAAPRLGGMTYPLRLEFESRASLDFVEKIGWSDPSDKSDSSDRPLKKKWR